MVPPERSYLIRITRNSQVLAAFMARKQKIDTILPRLTALSADHFGTEPDTVT